MFSEDCSEKVCSFLRLNVVSALFLVVLALPYFKYHGQEVGTAKLANFTQKISMGPQESQPDLPFTQFLQILSRSSYSGTWLSSIKQSKLLKEENGTIELRASEKPSESERTQYTILIKIYDGKYRDYGNYQIQLDSSSIKTQQQFIANQLVFETLSPVIGLYRGEHVFKSQKQKPIYINKLKFRLNFKEQLRIQLLLAAQYQINIITENLEQKWELLTEIMLSIVILVQVFTQAYGSYCLLLEVDEQKLIANSVSPTFFKLGVAFDTAEFFILCYLIFYQNMKFLTFATYMLLLHIVFLEFEIYSRISQCSKLLVGNFTNREIQQIQNQIQADSMYEFQSETGEPTLIQNPTLKQLILTLQRNENYLMLLSSHFVFYMNNMQNYIYLAFFVILALPQITRNCRVGNKVNYQIQSIIIHAYPRLLPILYVRGLGEFTGLGLQPRYVFCLILILTSLASAALLYVQKKHGARSILPKFLIPKGLKTKFKFFIIQDQNTTCVVCQSQLAQIPAELRGKAQSRGIKQQITYNKVVLTPCHHKFHAHCLQKWMQSRIQCPSCHHALPPNDSL